MLLFLNLSYIDHFVIIFEFIQLKYNTSFTYFDKNIIIVGIEYQYYCWFYMQPNNKINLKFFINLIFRNYILRGVRSTKERKKLIKYNEMTKTKNRKE